MVFNYILKRAKTLKCTINTTLFVQFTSFLLQKVGKSGKLGESFFKASIKTRINEGFPCLTEKESNDPGKPCIFPFNSRAQIETQKSVFGNYSDNNFNELTFNCTYFAVTEPWCYTKIHNESMPCKFHFNIHSQIVKLRQRVLG